jgi:RNA polymerase sigma factor (sigma-70 family)
MEDAIISMSEGDPKAFKLVYDFFMPKMMYALQKHCKCDDDIAKEVLQIVFINVWKNRASFTGVDNIFGYLKMMCINTFINLSRKDTVEQNARDEYYRMSDNRIKDDYSDLYIAVSQLPNKQKKVIEYRLLGMSYEEIAKEMKVSVITINHQISSAYSKIRTKLKFA